MKKFICAVLAAAFAAALLPPAVFAKEISMENTAYRVYVRANSDSASADGSREHPFPGIAEARDYVRTLDKSKGDIVVEISGGYYYIDETIVFDERDSGSGSCTVRYAAADGENPVISAGRQIKGEWKNEVNGVYSIEYDRGRKLRALYVNDERRYMTSSEIKGRGADGEMQIKAGRADWAWADGVAATGVLFGRNSIPADTRNADDIELMTKTTWNTSIVCVDRLEERGTKVCAHFQMPYGAIAQTPGWGNEYQFKETNIVYNVFEWLDEPGEFYYDKTGKRLYYYPKPGEDMNSVLVVAPELETVIDIRGGSINSHVSNISFDGITFAHTDWNLCEVDGSRGRATNQGAAVLYNYDEVDWHGAVYRAYDVAPAAVQLSAADNVSFFNNTFIHTGNEGLSLVNDVCDVEVRGNIIFDTGGSGLLIGHPQHMYIGDKGEGLGRFSDREKYDKNTEASCKRLKITNNLIKSTSRLFWGDSGVMVFACEDLLFEHNQVEDTPYSGLSLGWGWWNMNGSDESAVPGVPTQTTKNNKIIANRFINTITILADAGAIYTLGDMPGTEISENYIKHIGTDGAKASYHIRGIHVDEGTRHVSGEKNVIDIGTDFAAIDCGNWGNKGGNKWNGNYSTSDSYTTTGDYEPDTVITNRYTSENAEWSGEAASVVENAGIQKEYNSVTESGYFKTENYNLPYVPPQSSSKTAAVIAASAVGAAAVAAGTAVIVKKKKRTRR